ncbi:MAG: hypothetical protein WCI84_10240 [Bacteroidota bacterium]
MIIHFRTLIILLAVTFSFAQPQQKEYYTTKVVPVPDSLRIQFDTLIVTKIDENKMNHGWIKLCKGMSVSQVITLVGKPTGIEYSSLDASVTWHYGKRTVVFDNIKETLRYWRK